MPAGVYGKLLLLPASCPLQSRAGLPGLDPFQLVAMLLRLTRLTTPTEGDDAADYQQYVASGAWQACLLQLSHGSVLRARARQ